MVYLFLKMTITENIELLAEAFPEMARGGKCQRHALNLHTDQFAADHYILITVKISFAVL